MVKKRGNAQRLRNYWERGAGAAKIRWGTGGDFDRCVAHLSKYLRDAKGYCALHHRRVLGYTTTQHAARLRGRRKR